MTRAGTKPVRRTISMTRRLAYGGLTVAMGVILPQLFHMVGGDMAGKTLLPMHIPVLLGGFFLGPVWGGLVGLLTPAASCLITGFLMPAPMMLPFMMLELAGYGMLTGLFFQKLRLPTFPSLLLAMLGGRTIYFLSLVTALQLLHLRLPFAASAWASAAGAVVTGLPGIVVQMVVIPALLLALKKGGLLYER